MKEAITSHELESEENPPGRNGASSGVRCVGRLGLCLAPISSQASLNRRDPQNARARFLLAQVWQTLGEGYARLHYWMQADRYLTRLIEQHPEKVEAWLQRGQVRQAARERDQNHDDAAADFREVIRRAPDHFRARLSLAECLLSDARIAAAKSELLICRQLNPAHTEPLIGLAICAAEEQDLQRAQALLAQALSLEPTSLVALSMQGDFYLRRKEYAKAIHFYKKLLSLDPTNLAVHLNLAQAFRQSGRLEDAKNEEALFQQLRQQKGKRSSAP